MTILLKRSNGTATAFVGNTSSTTDADFVIGFHDGDGDGDGDSNVKKCFLTSTPAAMKKVREGRIRKRSRRTWFHKKFLRSNYENRRRRKGVSSLLSSLRTITTYTIVAMIVISTSTISWTIASIRNDKMARSAYNRNTQHQESTETENKTTDASRAGVAIDLESPITKQELQNARQSLQQAKQRAQNLSPLRPIDKTKYTVRINTWRRNDQLVVSVKHLLTCSGVAQVQIVWCETEDREDGEDEGHGAEKEEKKFTRPPQEIINYTRGESPMVVIEYHSINSLNERFNILPTTQTPTYGILSVDDDVLRPCEALDDGFFRWTDHPDRLVGYDYRMHIVSSGTTNNTRRDLNGGARKGNNNIDNGGDNSYNTTTWSYGYLSSTRRYNRYSMVLPRFSFIHIDYLSLYTKYIPKRIEQTINDHFNCEDIAMSFFVSSLTQAKVPLLANQWSISTMVKLTSPAAISQTFDHKSLRDKCVNDFAYLLGLKDGYADLIKETDSTIDNRIKDIWGSENGDDYNPYENDIITHHGHQQETSLSKWMVLENHRIWNSKRRNHAFSVGADANDHPFYIREDFVQRRKDFVKELKQWARGNGSFQDAHRKLIDNIRKAGLLSAS